MLALAVLPILAAAGVEAWGKILVTFGDSYTDQSRLGYFFANNSFPPPHYQEQYPPIAAAANGGASWVRYAEVYGNLTAYNYAVSGAACSNLLTPRPHQGPAAYPDGNYPSVLEYEIPAYAVDWVNNSTNQTVLDADTVYTLWIGTNDVGVGSLLTGNQTTGVTIVNVTRCGIDWMTQLYGYGARKFILMNMIPLWLAPLYSDNPPAPLDRYWPYPRNATDYNTQMQELVSAGNALWDLQVPAAVPKLANASAAVFSAFDLFWDIYHNPSMYLNGTGAPLNVTGYNAHSNITGGDTVTSSSPDSFMWYDSLHPSEQSDRVLAREIVSAINGQSKYATYYNW